jgi:hypothetical protein
VCVCVCVCVCATTGYRMESKVKKKHKIVPNTTTRTTHCIMINNLYIYIIRVCDFCGACVVVIMRRRFSHSRPRNRPFIRSNLHVYSVIRARARTYIIMCVTHLRMRMHVYSIDV